MSDNVDEWVKAFESVTADIEEISDAKAEQFARTAAQLQREAAPVRTGRSKRSIAVRKGRDREGRFWEFGPTAKGWHLRFFEYGTSRQPARPFIRPAIERAIATVWPR